MSSDEAIFIRPAETARMLGIGLSTLWARAKHEADFPKPRKFGARTTVFYRPELLAWAESRVGRSADKTSPKVA